MFPLLDPAPSGPHEGGCRSRVVRVPCIVERLGLARPFGAEQYLALERERLGRTLGDVDRAERVAKLFECEIRSTVREFLLRSPKCHAAVERRLGLRGPCESRFGLLGMAQAMGKLGPGEKQISVRFVGGRAPPARDGLTERVVGGLSVALDIVQVVEIESDAPVVRIERTDLGEATEKPFGIARLSVDPRGETPHLEVLGALGQDCIDRSTRVVERAYLKGRRGESSPSFGVPGMGLEDVTEVLERLCGRPSPQKVLSERELDPPVGRNAECVGTVGAGHEVDRTRVARDK